MEDRLKSWPSVVYGRSHVLPQLQEVNLFLRFFKAIAIKLKIENVCGEGGEYNFRRGLYD